MLAIEERGGARKRERNSSVADWKCKGHGHFIHAQKLDHQSEQASSTHVIKTPDITHGVDSANNYGI
jgi:hypothetical protein